MPDTNEPEDQEAVTGFDQTNGLAGNLVGDSDETVDAHDDDEPSDVGSIYTGGVNRGSDTAHEFDAPESDRDGDGSDGEEPI